MARVGASFSCGSVPIDFTRYLGKRYLHTSGYLQQRMALQVPGRQTTMVIVGPRRIASSNMSYACFVSRGPILFTQNVGRLLSQIPLTSTAIVGQRVVTCFNGAVCCHYYGGRQLVGPGRRRCVRKLFHEQKIARAPRFSRCVRCCSLKWMCPLIPMIPRVIKGCSFVL